MPAADFAPVAGTVRADIAVVGGGYTGLSAALHLAEAGRDVAVIEARTPGWGASGRNGGQVIAGVKHDPEALLALFGASVGGRMVATVGAAPDAVFGLIARHGIACDAVRTGWIQPAVSAATLGVSRERVRQWRAAGADVSLLDAAEIARLLGSQAYVGGMLDRRGGTVQPLSYARGLAAAAVRAGARIFAGSPATGLERAGSGWRLAVPGGEVVAERVILATNAYADRLHDGLRRSVVAVPSWQVATGNAAGVGARHYFAGAAIGFGYAAIVAVFSAGCRRAFCHWRARVVCRAAAGSVAATIMRGGGENISAIAGGGV